MVGRHELMDDSSLAEVGRAGACSSQADRPRLPQGTSRTQLLLNGQLAHPF